MKKVLAKLVVVCIAALVLFLCGATVVRRNRVLKFRESIFALPELTLQTIDRDLFSTRGISEGPLLITYFHPECEHCQYEISSLVKSRLTEKGIAILLISSADSSLISSFINQYGIQNDTMFHVLSDTSLVFSNLFRPGTIPSNYIYDKELKLVKILNGETTVETIIKYMQNDGQY